MTTLVDPDAHQQNAGNKNQDQDHDKIEDELPEKFRGKSPGEIVDMYTNLETQYGRQANELGFLRDTTDRLTSMVASKTESDLIRGGASPSDEEEELDADALLTDPKGSISRVVSKATKALTDDINSLKQGSALDKFAGKHPTYVEDMSNEDFQKYVAGSNYRQKLAYRAREQGDLDAADELWTGWEEIQEAELAANEAERQEEEAQRKQELNDAGGSLRSSGGGKGGDNTNSGPSFTRLELQDMYLNNPEEYNRRQPEIIAAYRAGKVS